MSWVRTPLAAPISSLHRDTQSPLPRATKFTPVAASALAKSPKNLYAGTSGWAYPTWKPGFYPADLPPRAFLHNYAARLTSVEVNYTFRTLPEPEQLQGWLDATPPGFRFTFKAPQTITHFQRLVASEAAVAELIASIEPARAAQKFGCLLFQLPPNFAADPIRLTTFLALPSFADKSLKLAFEFRHASWFADPILEILRRHNVALCTAETDDLLTPDIATADFRYFRLRRSGGYKPRELKAFAARFSELAKTQEVFAYFKHEDEPTGALNALALLKAANTLARKAAA